MRKLYTLLMYLVLPWLLAYLAWRGLRDRGYVSRWAERFGCFSAPRACEGIVLHAASVGEVNAAEPLVRALQQHLPEVPLTLTTFTPTGSRRVRALFGKRVSHVFAPFDLPGAVKRFLARTRPRVLIVLETEIWPNLYAHADALGVPVLLANARLSEKSSRSYARARSLIAETLARLSWAGAQTAADAERLVQCGARPGRVEVTGNLKFELAPPATLPAEGQSLREAWGADRPVITAGSSHAGDEDVLLAAFRRLREQVPTALLILVPRHPERFAEAADKARAAGFCVTLHSEEESGTPETEVFVIDTMGELLRYYASCDVAFVGGTFAGAGGHNLLEPAALGKPVLFGPDTRNTAEVAERLVSEGAAVRAQSDEMLAEAARRWLLDAGARRKAGEAARRVVAQGRGALQRHLVAVRHYVEQ